VIKNPLLPPHLLHLRLAQIVIHIILLRQVLFIIYHIVFFTYIYVLFYRKKYSCGRTQS
jgi:hypothetical protein